jgi:transposase-like protein
LSSAGPNPAKNGSWMKSPSASAANCTASGRAVDQHGKVLDMLVQCRRDRKAATRFFRKLLKGLCCMPRDIVTDKCGS